jgi:hypothetical protein
MEEKDYCIDAYLRTYIYQKILKYLEKKNCEICGSIENLCIHHPEDLMFTDILYKSLCDLKIDYKINYKDYSEDELRKIKIMVLGYHLYGYYNILCQKCHMEIHRNISELKVKINYKSLNKKYKWQIEYYKNKFPESSLEDFFYNFNKLYLTDILKKYSEQKMFKEEINNFKLIISKNLIKNQIDKEPGSKMTSAFDTRATGIKSINKIFQTYKLNYELVSYRNRSKKKINNVNETDKVYWIVLPLRSVLNDTSICK